MEIRKACENDIDEVMPIFDEARGTIASLGINQWQDGYPSRALIADDVARGNSYVAVVNSEIAASFAMIFDGEATYNKIYDGEWPSGNDFRNYVAIHRVVIAVKSRGQGIASEIMNFAADSAEKNGFKSLRIDTHRGNIVMRKMLEKQGFVHCGTIFLLNGDERVAYEKLL